MSAFYSLFLSKDKGKNTLQNIKETIIKSIPPMTKEINRPQIKEDSGNTLDILCDYFWLTIKNGGEYVGYKSEENKQYDFRFLFLFIWKMMTGMKG